MDTLSREFPAFEAFSSHLSFRIDECSAMSKRQMQGNEEGEEREDQAALLQNRDLRASWSLFTQRVAPAVEFWVQFLFYYALGNLRKT